MGKKKYKAKKENVDKLNIYLKQLKLETIKIKQNGN